MEKWEYKTVGLYCLDSRNEKEHLKKLNELGAQGWELIQWNGGGWYIFKRKIG